jgi:hypothetical protein
MGFWHWLSENVRRAVREGIVAGVQDAAGEMNGGLAELRLELPKPALPAAADNGERMPARAGRGRDMRAGS